MEPDKKTENNELTNALLFVAGAIISIIAIYTYAKGTADTAMRDSFTLFAGSNVMFFIFIIRITAQRQRTKHTSVTSLRWTFMVLSFALVVAGYYLLSEKINMTLAANCAWFATILMMAASSMAHYEIKQKTTEDKTG